MNVILQLRLALIQPAQSGHNEAIQSRRDMIAVLSIYGKRSWRGVCILINSLLTIPLRIYTSIIISAQLVTFTAFKVSKVVPSGKCK
jgi:hypothetical protein